MRYGIGSGRRCVCPYCRARRREAAVALFLFAALLVIGLFLVDRAQREHELARLGNALMEYDMRGGPWGAP